MEMTNEALCIRIQKGFDEAQTELIARNAALIRHEASKYRHFYGTDFSREDLEQIASMAMLRAARRFDARYGAGFSTFATLCMRQTLRREIQTHGLRVRLSVHRLEDINRVSKREGMLRESDCDPDERVRVIAKELNMKESTVREVMRARDEALSVVSLDSPLDHADNAATFGDRIPDATESVEETVLRGMLIEQMRNALEGMPARARRALEMRYGLNGNRICTLDDISGAFDLSREGARQLVRRAEQQLRQLMEAC